YIYTLSLHDALPIWLSSHFQLIGRQSRGSARLFRRKLVGDGGAHLPRAVGGRGFATRPRAQPGAARWTRCYRTTPLGHPRAQSRSEEHTSELQSREK